MVKRPMKHNPVRRLKKGKVEARHPQNPRHPVTLEDFLPCWFRMKIFRDGIEASCCNADKGEEKSDDLPLAPFLKELIESIPQEVNACEEKFTFTNDDLLLGDTLHNRPLYSIGYMRDERVNRILVDGASSVNILSICTVKELGIPMYELSESHVMIQGFNKEGQRAIGLIRLGITIEDMQSSTWLHVIDEKTSYNVLLGRPWIHKNKVVPSTYHQCLKYYKSEVEKKIVVDDEPFTENDETTTKRAEVTAGRAKAVTEEVQPNSNKSYRGDIASYGKKVTRALQYSPRRKKDEGFVAQNRLQNVALPTKRTNKGFDPNAYRLFEKDGYNPNEPSKLGKLPSESATRQPREGLGYKQPSLVRISIRRASNNYITVEDESTASYRPSVFDRLGKSTVRTSGFDRLCLLKNGNKFQRNYQSIKTPASPRIQKISKDFQSLVPSRMRRLTKLVVSCKEILKVKPYTVVYTKERDEDEESMGSYHVSALGGNGVSSIMEDDEKLEDVSPCYHISFNDGDPQEDKDAKDAPPELEEGVKAMIDALKEVNLGTDEEPRPTYISALLAIDEESTYIELLKEFKDVFAWIYKEMPGLDPKVAVHHLAIKNGARPVKQAQRCFRPDLVPLIKTEVNKLIEAGFIHEVKYPTCVSSIVPVRKKNVQIRVCVDLRDLNNTCSKDEFPLTIPELMIDATTGYEEMLFMDGSSCYNQICMALKDEELTAFRTPKGIYCYKVMPFGLKNSGATYQRSMQNIFHALLHKTFECYVDDLVVKSREKSDHLKDLRMVFELLRRYQLRMNPLKCDFGVTSGKFLGFIIRHRGIEIDQAKVDAILKMPKPRDIHELKSLQGKLAYLRRFISNLARRCQPFSRLMKKGVPFKWDQACSNAFESIKTYLIKPPVLAAPILGKSLILYISAQERMMTPNELNYSPIEKLCLALVFSIQRLKHYFKAHVVCLVSKANPIKFVMSKSVPSDRLARWYLQFQKFEILYISQKAIKGQALAHFLADHPIPDDWELTDKLPDEDAIVVEVQPPWKMYFDDVAHRGGADAGVVFVTFQGEVLP
ncbi:uncharacterized protein [Nicotiana tomentosiformis]|uniref:uncharacterized protein n=1 Tax=Nicotiana tomentosiformis TaxID=4098 RepID=UPI00388C95AE